MSRFLVLCNALIFGIVAYAAILNTWYPDFAYFSVQEDEYLEWATFWGFALACVAYLSASVKQWRNSRSVPWFLFGVGLFCFVVAMEEISWGQRLLGYRPPAYFLEQNFQQELNFHNIVDTSYRKLALKLIILLYGVALPLLGAFRLTGRLIERLGIVAPSIWLIPSFAAMAWIYHDYPWSYSGEWVEAMMALGFLAAAMQADKPNRLTLRMGLTVAVVIALGVTTGLMSRVLREGDPNVLKAAELEIEALKRDFLSGKVKTRCNLHKRLFTFQQEYDQQYLQQGEFAALQSQGLPEERAEFLIDPWNSPYWVRDRCVNGGDRRRVVFVYSFGPNRKRDSSHLEILGDDVGAYILLTR